MSEPKCPACGLEFAWSQAVPLEKLVCGQCGYQLIGLVETRCPECGEAFTWEQALEDYHRKCKPLFEYRWRDEPVRSLYRTWRMCLRPGRLWRTIDLHDPVRIGPLLLVAALAFVIIGGFLPVCTGTYRWLIEMMYSWRWGSTAGAMTVADLPACIAESMLQPAVYVGLCPLILWWVSTFGALQLFQQSMRLARVRPVQVVRVCVYSAVLLSPLMVVAGGIALLCLSGLGALPPWRGDEGVVLVCGMGLLSAWVFWSIWLAYRHYLRMPHGFGVALASAVIAWLVVTVVMLLPALVSG